METSFHLMQDNEIVLSTEQLLTMFNRNISKNAELLDYIGQNNIFGIIAKARNESVHSRFVTELLSGDFFNGDSRESTLVHFIDLLLYRASSERKSEEVNEHLRKAVLTRSVMFEKMASECELTVTDYQKSYSSFNTQKHSEKDDRIDIYLKFKLLTPVAGRHELEVFIENKVNSSEFDSQTVRYFEACDNCGYKRPFQLFVYLTPQPVRDMDQYDRLDEKVKPACPHYIHICYQDILDFIIEPLLIDDKLAADKKAMLKEMGTLFNATEAMKESLKLLASKIKPLALLKKVNDCAIVGPQNGANPYLVYSPDAWRASNNKFCFYLPFDDLYVYSGKVYVSPNRAVTVAIEDYKKKHHKSNEDLVRDFSAVFSGKGGGIPLVSEKKQNGNAESDIKGIFIRKKIPVERLQKINDILGEQFSVKPIDNESYNALMCCNVQLYHGVPVSGNALPCEIERLLQNFNAYCYYEQVGDTPFFFRKDIVDERILNINKMKVFEDRNLIEKCKDTSLLLDFFNSRRNLVLSVYKIMLEAEHDNNVYEEKLKIYRKLIKP